MKSIKRILATALMLAMVFTLLGGSLSVSAAASVTCTSTTVVVDDDFDFIHCFCLAFLLFYYWNENSAFSNAQTVRRRR